MKKKKKNLPANAGDMGLILDPGRFHIPRSNSACMPQLLKPLCSRAHKPQLLKPMSLHPMLLNKEKPPQ